MIEHMFDTIDLDTDPVAVLGDAVDTVAAEVGDDRSGVAVSQRLVGLLEARERLDAVITRLAGRWDRQRCWEADAALSGASWLAHRTPLPRHKAQRLIGNGRLTVDHQAVDDALTVGDVTSEHVEVITKVAGNHRRELVRDHIEVLVDSAAGLGVDDYATVTRRWAALADDQATNREFTQQHERRGLYLSSTLDGTVLVDGRFDPDAGATVITALDRLAPPDPVDSPDGPRSLPQRRADVLVDLCHHNLTGTTTNNHNDPDNNSNDSNDSNSNDGDGDDGGVAAPAAAPTTRAAARSALGSRAQVTKALAGLVVPEPAERRLVSTGSVQDLPPSCDSFCQMRP